MLQKTASINVVPVFKSFIAKFRTVDELATADETQIRALVAPLGLPRRAKLLKDMAVQVVTLHRGIFPLNESDLRALPGIGEYAAGAIRSQAFGLPTAMIDINVMRIYHRLFSLPYNPRSKPSKLLRETVEATIPTAKAPDFNLALLDFGARVCTSRNPNCHDCPLATICDYYAAKHV